ncbi:DNA/RNA nuclease SfsA [Acidaminococcus fermentans]|uniref:DNA/RNA nuclease SfsA n=1 Tax=Acidaminococcus fermentans TaxID=905 RepID=UPI002432C099|nr:DNA/RNA nuclease SfsA [Acidaminococcus fermentans]
MHYPNITFGRFLSRPNRFIAQVEIGGREETCHVKNTGRCRELLVPGAIVYLTASDNPERKTKYDLVAVEKGSRLINMDSQAPNKVVQEWLEQGGLPGLTRIQSEYRYDQSRFDFYLEQGSQKAFLEVKGVTLEDHGVVRFPDAPTARGAKHLHELIRASREGYGAYVFLVIQMENVDHFEPNWQTDPDFGQALLEAQEAGVQILAYDCQVAPASLSIGKKVPIQIK